MYHYLLENNCWIAGDCQDQPYLTRCQTEGLDEVMHLTTAGLRSRVLRAPLPTKTSRLVIQSLGGPSSFEDMFPKPSGWFLSRLIFVAVILWSVSFALMVRSHLWHIHISPFVCPCSWMTRDDKGLSRLSVFIHVLAWMAFHR